MRICIIVLVLILTGCKSPQKEDLDFTFFKWNLHESYYLKFNSSDTVYCVDAYADKEAASFAVLNKDQKERIQAVLDTIAFPKKEIFEDYDIDDGANYAFLLQDKKQLKKVSIHGYAGPKEFWYFGEMLEKMKLDLQFAKTNKEIDLKEIKKITLIEM